MTMDPVLKSRVRNVVLALLALGLMCALPTAMSFVLAFGFVLIPSLFGGSMAGNAAADFLMANSNLFTALVYVAFGAPMLAWLYVMRDNARRTRALAPEFRWRELGPMPMLKSAFLAFAMTHFTTIVMIVIAIALPHIMDQYTDLVESSGMSDYGIMWVFSTVILPPLVEETGFRGLGLTYLRRAGIPFWAANLIQAVLFGIFHLNIVQGIYAGILGLVLGYLAHHYRSLAPAMVMHGVYNIWGTLGTDIENMLIGGAPDIVFIVLGIALPVLAFRLIMGEGSRPQPYAVPQQPVYGAVPQQQAPYGAPRQPSYPGMPQQQGYGAPQQPAYGSTQQQPASYGAPQPSAWQQAQAAPPSQPMGRQQPQPASSPQAGPTAQQQTPSASQQPLPPSDPTRMP